MKRRHNPIGEAGTQIAIAAATAAVATTIGVLITNWLTKRATVASVASGETPLPPGSHPTTSGPPVVATPTSTPSPAPSPAPQPAPQQLSQSNLLNVANSIAQGIAKQPCPPGYHAVPTGQPNFPYMCIADSP